MPNEPLITMSDPAGIAIVVAVALIYLAIRMLPRLLAGFNAYISPAEVKRCMEGEDRPLLLDVRSPAEFTGDLGHIPGAINIPLAQLRGQLAAGEFLSNAQRRTIITICRTDSRAAFGVRILKSRGFTNVLVMGGGMIGWLDQDFPVEHD